MELTKITTYQEEILRALIQHTSAKSPLSALKLSKIVGLKPRIKGEESTDIRAIVNTLRKKRYPICANGRGYFYARENDDLSKYIHGLEGRIDAMQEALVGLKSAYHNIGTAPADAPIKPYVERAVRTEAGGVRIERFELGPKGMPIIPKGVELV